MSNNVQGGSVEIVGPCNRGARGDMTLVRQGERYYVVSSVDAMFTGPETLVFRSDEKGEITEWLEVAGGRGMTREDAIAQLEAEGPES